MHHFAYRDGVLHAEAVDLVGLAAAVGTPFYCYSTATLTRHYRVFAGAFADVPSLVCYAMKANSNQAVIATLARLGAGADVVSGASCKRARAAGIPPEKIMFSGVGKTARELALAVDAGILCVNVESEPELELLSPIAAAQGPRRPTSRCASIPTSMPRPTPRSRPASPRTSSAFRSAARARSMRTPRSCRACGSPASTCISAARSPTSRRSTMPSRCCPISCARCAPTATRSSTSISAAASAFPIARTTSRRRDPDAYAAIVKRATRDLGCTLIFEPGRLIVGNAGILVTRVLYVKRGEAKTFVIVDAGDERPHPPDALRGASRHPAGARAARRRARGSSPTWSARSARPAISWRSTATWRSPQPGDLLAVMTAGAYGAVQAGTYNTRALVPEVLVRDGEWALVRPRLEVDALIALDRLPPWL